VPRARAWRPDLVVAEEFEAAGPVAAAACGARLVSHGLGLMIPAELWASLRVEDALAELHERWDTPLAARDLRAVDYLEVSPPALRPPGERTWTNTRPLRPVPGMPARADRLPPGLEDLPYGRTVHLTLGTLFHETPGVLETALAGLRELAVNVVVTTGPGTDPSRLGPQPPHVVVAPYLAHSLLLPRCDAVVSQGGAGIMLGAFAHGLPQLILPQGADQVLNGEIAGRTGGALVLAGDDLTPEAVTAAVTRLLDDPAHGVAARRIRAEIAAMPSPDAVIADLAA
jgi:UDP:flavonoid glycosyltransferase YjiC (YdhE family)